MKARCEWARRVVIGLAVFFSLVAASVYLHGPAIAGEEQAARRAATGLKGRGAVAAEPTAAVNFHDFRYRYFDLEGGRHVNSFETEGAYVFDPRFKLAYKLIGAETDRTGTSEADFSLLSLRPIALTPIEPFGFKGKIALGVEWQLDLGEFDEGTATGSDVISPFVGIGWLFTEQDFFVAVVQYFHSYDEDRGAPDVNRTGTRVTYIRTLPAIEGWLKFDFKGAFDHENGDKFSETLELQLGKRLTPRVGVYAELLLGDAVFNTNAYEIGGGVALRILF